MCHQLTRQWMKTRDDGSAATLGGIRKTPTSIPFIKGFLHFLT